MRQDHEIKIAGLGMHYDVSAIYDHHEYIENDTDLATKALPFLFDIIVADET